MRCRTFQRLTVLALLVAAMPGVALAQGDFSSWVDFTAPDGSFSIAFPTRPREHDMKLMFAGKIADTKTFGVSQMSAVYTITLLDTRERDNLTESEIATLGVSASGGVPVLEHEERVGGHLTRDVLLRRGEFFEKVHVVVQGRRAYRLAAMMREDYSGTPTIKYLFESFMLTEK